MDLEFDKEIDVILRKARDSGAAAGMAADSPHVDADAIAAFAENALPVKARDTYVRHFADCDRCRQMLSQSISSNNAGVAIAAPAEKTMAAASMVPWYQRLFRTPNLAFAMGALVLAFSGMLGYFAIQSRKNADTSDFAQVKETAPRVSSPAAASNTMANAASSNAAAGSLDNMSTANSAAAPLVSNPEPTRTNGPSASQSDEVTASPTQRDENKTAAESITATEAPKPVTAAPQPPAAAESVIVEKERKEVAARPKDGDSADKVASADSTAQTRGDSSLSENAAKKRLSGPRNTQIQNQQQNAVAGDSPSENSARRQVGGKTFERRDGAWYDSAYHGAATKNYRRGTDEYKKLDSGLRSITDSLAGTVVIVWKSNAYRIQ